MIKEYFTKKESSRGNNFEANNNVLQRFVDTFNKQMASVGIEGFKIVGEKCHCTTDGQRRCLFHIMTLDERISQLDGEKINLIGDAINDKELIKAVLQQINFHSRGDKDEFLELVIDDLKKLLKIIDITKTIYEEYRDTKQLTLQFIGKQNGGKSNDDLYIFLIHASVSECKLNNQSFSVSGKRLNYDEVKNKILGIEKRINQYCSRENSIADEER